MSDSIKNLYQQIHQNILESNGSFRWLNLGYWESAQTIEKACQDLVSLVAKFGTLANNQKVLDVGFGYGRQDIFLLKLYPNLQITGINLVEKQLEIAKSIAVKEGVSSQINFELGDATQLSFPENTFDRIIAIESAFHFDTREVFLQNAFKILKKNGVICLTEGLADKRNIDKEDFKQRSEFLGIPLANQYEIEEYVEILRQIGFTSIEFLDISDAVIPYGAIAVKHKRGWRTDDEIKLPKDKSILNDLVASFKKSTTIDKYYIIKARKE